MRANVVAARGTGRSACQAVPVLVLLPPSETKAGRARGRPLDLASLSLPGLTAVRRSVLEAVAAASARPDAMDVLQVPPTLRAEVEANLRWDAAPAVPVAELYRGVLYDALDHDSLAPGAKRRARSRVLVVSAVHGALRLDDRVPPYRVNPCARLPVGPDGRVEELAVLWREHLARELPTLAHGVVVDCRSDTYRSMWRPTGEVAQRRVSVRVLREADGGRSVVSHMAKHTRGLVARHLVSRAGRDPSSAQGLAAAVGEAFEVELSPPARDGSRVLDVVVRG
jgi:cytoplasmic iron level regulating protein YaaA (DUF328/UPF0246 family)